MDKGHCELAISSIVGKYGTAPEIGEHNYRAYPKLLKCVQEMDRIIEAQKEDIRKYREKLTACKSRCKRLHEKKKD